MAYTTIDDPSKYFQTAIWTGDGNDDRSITFDGNSDMQPDMVWTKRRPTSSSHGLRDSTRGATVELFPDSSDDELAVSDRFQAFESDGFQVGTNADINGTSNNTYVAWAWKANGGTTTTNDASSTSVGTIDSVYQANTTAGFSIVTYTGTGSAGTVAHGLGVKPEWIVIKNRGKDEGWAVYHGANTSAPQTDGLSLNSGNATSDSADYWNDTAPTTTTFSVAADDRSGGSYNFVAYVFNSVQGYNKFGTYTGNGSTDGPFVFTGFQPAWIMIKRTDNTGSWLIFDNKRKGYNPEVDEIESNTSSAEVSNDRLGILSNGFKIRNSAGYVNADSATYVYMAFAEHPFTSSKGVPTTAR